MKNQFKYFLILSAVLLRQFVYCQNENTKWYFGNQAGLDFMTNPPTVLTNGVMNTAEGCSSIADANGNLLFYTDGLTVWNQTHAVMANGTGLLGSGSTSQSGVIVKKPGSSSIYYVFTLTAAGLGSLYYSEIDMTLAAGMGSVTVKNTPLSPSLSEHLTSVKHCNGSDVWIMVHTNNSNTFKAFLISNTGVNLVPVLSNTGSVFATISIGCMKFSPNGKKLGFAQSGLALVEVFDFDASTGILSNPLSLNTSNLVFYPYGVEFSPDCSKLYAKGTSILGQWDLCAGTNVQIVSSLTTFTTQSMGIGSLQLAKDGKIYGARFSQSILGVVNNPNLAGTLCNYVDNGISIAPKVSMAGLPNFITSGFKVPPPPFTYSVGLNIGCQTAAFTAPSVAQNFTQVGCSAIGYSLTGIKWDFGDPLSGATNTTTVVNPFHSFSTLGTFTVNLILYYSCGGGTDTIKQAVNINQPCLSVLSNSITCASLGSATVAALGGIGPFSYTWMPTNQTNPIATGLSPGTYTISVHDAGANLTYTATTMFTSLIPLSGNLNSSNSVTCNGVGTGTANVTNLAGGSANSTNLNYLWTDGSAVITTPSVNTLSGGTWSLTVTDAITGCQINQVFFISQPPAMTLNISAASPSVCLGGSVTLTGTNSGGTPGYTYTWTNGPVSNTQTVTEFVPGPHIYTLSSRDTYSCLIHSTISIDHVAPPVLLVPNVLICPLEFGTLQVSGAASYTWSNNSNNNFLTDNPTISKQYTVTGSALGCSSSTIASIILKPLPFPIFNNNSPRCEGSSLSLSGFGGSSFNWSGPNGFNSTAQYPVINPVTLNNAGVYTVIVTGVNSCTAAITKTIVVNPKPNLTALADTVCIGEPLTLLASSSGGTIFAWTGPSGFNSSHQNPSIINSAPNNSGTYTVKVTSANGCTNTATSTASVIASPVLNYSLSNSTLCAQGFNGSLNTVTLTSSGAANYTLLTAATISNSNPAGPVFPLTSTSSLNIGITSLTLQGSNAACTVSTHINLSIIPNPVIVLNSLSPTICLGQSFTFINQGASNYTWMPSPDLVSSNLGQTAVASPTTSSLFSVYGGSLGCNSALQTTSLTVNPLPQISIAPLAPTLCLNSFVNLSAQGTSTSYSWAPGISLNYPFGSTVSASPAFQQIYTVTGSLNSCTLSAMVTVSVLSLPKPVFTIPKPELCAGEIITFIGAGGDPKNREAYLWKGTTNTLYAGQIVTITANSLLSGNYTLTVTDVNGCKAYTTNTLVVYDLPDGMLNGSIMKKCIPFTSDFVFTPASNTSNSTTAQWLLNNITYSSTFSYTFNTAGIYSITGTFKDPGTNCTNTKTFYVEAYPLPVADFIYTPAKPVENLEEVIFTNTSTGEGLEKWNWHFIKNNGFRSEHQHTNYAFTDAGEYPVAMIVTNNKGCKDTIIKSIKVESDFTMYVPNVFTPNGDELNDTFLPVIRSAKFYELSVFDRWGARLFFTKDLQVGWDGSYKGEPCKVDVYIWKINVSSLSGEAKIMTGQVLLNR